MNTRVQSGRTGASIWRWGLRPLLGAFLLLLLLGWGSAAPARAESGTINGPRTGTIYVWAGETLNIVDGAQISGGSFYAVLSYGTVNISGGSLSGAAGLAVNGGTATITGGSISGDNYGVYASSGTTNVSGGTISGHNGVFVGGGTVDITGGTISGDYGVTGGGTVTISGGTISGVGALGVGVGPSGGMWTISGGSISGYAGVGVFGATVSITGGSISGSSYGVLLQSGSLSVYGCVQLSGSQLTGTLQDGTAISTNTSGIGPGNLISPAGTPQITCPSNVVVQAAAGACSASVNPGTAAAHDNCTSSLPVVGVRSDGKALTDPYPVGTTTVTWSATNTVGSASCPQTITVNGTAPPPVITLDGANPLTVECHSSLTDPGATATDGCSGASLPVSTSGSLDVNTPGSYTLTYSATNSTGRTASATRTVNVVDTIAPAITLNGANPLTVECHASLVDPGATASDACAGSVAVTASGTVDPNTPGSYTLTYRASDPSGNTASATRTVNVVDTTAPTITLNGASTMTVECHTSFSDPGAAANDTCAGSVPVSVSGAVDVNSPGTYTLTYHATDPSGNQAAPVTRTVQVVDTTPPVVTPRANITQPADAGQCYARVTVGTATATDTCAGALTPTGTRSDGKALTDPYPVGTTTITWTATDPSGNKATATQTVTALDQQPPTITCNANLTVPATEAGGARVGFGPPTASDNCPGVTAYYTPGTGFLFPLGTTTVTGTALDAAGNTATCSFTVTVQPRADVAVSQTASPSPVDSGSQLTYTITVANNGPQAAQGVALTDPLPAGTSFVSATRSANLGTLTTPKGTGSTVSWSIGTLTSGQSVSLTVVVKVSAKAGATLTNTATVSSSSPVDPNSANNSSTVSTPVVAKR